MSATLKIAFLALLAVAMSALFFFLGAGSVARGYVVVGKTKPVLVTYAESPVVFSLAVGGMFAFALLAFVGAIAFVLARKEKREYLLSLASERVFRVRAGVRWLLAVFVVVLGALVIAALLRA